MYKMSHKQTPKLTWYEELDFDLTHLIKLFFFYFFIIGFQHDCPCAIGGLVSERKDCGVFN